MGAVMTDEERRALVERVAELNALDSAMADALKAHDGEAKPRR